ncbi:hypothetical protein LTR62_003233 [Meristemomyces frigidus]|uniref:Uncharacterized protein n=1 Tax=Meristemomyces frigidus TaxID=1508187 RepID=A0AAN7TFB2_9PEZI|nr:hypothetical protein LTR62_003233 [Meristemomyces frigidus]
MLYAGIQGNYTLTSWSSTTFEVPSSFTPDRVLLNFGAVDYEATVFINAKDATFHRGGYFAFTVDVTSYLNANGSNELLIFVHDPTDSDPYVVPIGKQTLTPSHIFYTPCSGIWQSVWIESAPLNYITQLDIAAGANGQVNATVSSSGNSSAGILTEVIDRNANSTIATYQGLANTACIFSVGSISTWAPETPVLYDIFITLGDDRVSSYTGFRTISRGVVDGIERPLLNGKFVLPFGTLDQGFWPDGIYTPPSREAMVSDLQTLKNLGFNMIRKHIKVKTALYYQAYNKMGLLKTILPNPVQQAEFARQLDLLITQQRVFPSIFTWVLYNEGWGQLTTSYPEFDLTARIRQLDPTRLVDSTTGWYDHGAGDYSDNHHYANPPYDPARIGLQGEFVGIGQKVSIEHLWNVQEAIDTINQTYEIDQTITAWNYRGHRLLTELQEQIGLFACSGGVWTQTTDVEGEVNGLLTHDRRVLRPDIAQWQADISGLYGAAASRTNSSMPFG